MLNKSVFVCLCQLILLDLVKTGKVPFTINDQILKLHTSGQLKLDEEVFFYKYSDGELIFLNCGSAIGTNKLTYYDAQGSLIFQTDAMSTAPTFRSVMTARNNNYYIACDYHLTSSSETSYYRHGLKFVLDGRVCDDANQLNLSVNGLKLAHKCSGLGNTYYYEYSFERTLNVSCQKNNSERGRMLLDSSNFITAFAQPRSKMQTVIATEGLKDSTLHCAYLDPYFTAELILKKRAISGARVTGLTEKNIEYQHSKNDTFYSMNYKYSFNETVQLTCFSNYSETSEIQWFLRNGSSVLYPQENFIFFGMSATLKLTLTAENNATSIQCIVIDLHGNPAYVVDVFLNLDPNSVVSVDDVDPTIFNTGASNGVLSVVVTISVMCVCAICVCACCCCKKKKQRPMIEIPVEKCDREAIVIPETEYDVVYNHRWALTRL